MTDSPPDPFAGPDWDRPDTIGAASASSPSAGTRSGSSGPAKGRRVKVSRRRKRVLRRRRRIGWILLGIGGLILVTGAWLVVTGLLARSELSQVRADVRTLRSQISAGDFTGARATADELAKHAHRAHELTTGPAWAVGADIPGGGEVLKTIRGVTANIDVIGRDALPALVAASSQLDPSSLRGPDGTIDLARLAATAPDLNRAARVMDEATSDVADLPAHTWLSTIDSARSDVLAQLTALGKTVHAARQAAAIAPTMLGLDGPKSYMLAFQTGAEIRGTGGLPGAFAIVQADHGKLTFARFESDSTLTNVTAGINLGPAYDQLYAADKPYDEYADSNVSPNFPYAAQIWVAMWKNYSGQQLDGAVAVDPTALSYLLKVVGPVPMADGTTVSASNVVALTQQTVYEKYPADESAARKEYQLDIARALSQHLLDTKTDTVALVKAAGRAASERRLMAWSADPAVEAELATTPLGGAVIPTTAPYAGLSLNNAGATKLDYYLDATLTWQRISCGDPGDVTVTITLTNNAPANLPAYVYGATGQPGLPSVPGDNRTVVSYYATNRATMSAATLNGVPTGAASGSELGHPVLTMMVDLPRGSTQTIVLHLTEPAATAAPVVLPQPMVRPLTVTIDNAACK